MGLFHQREDNFLSLTHSHSSPREKPTRSMLTGDAATAAEKRGVAS